MMLLALMVVAITRSVHPDLSTDSLTTYIETRQWDRAVGWIDRQLIDTPFDPLLRFRKAQVLAWSGQYEAAVRLLEGLLRDNPADTDARLLQARIRSWQGRHDEARRLYRAVEPGDPGYPEAQAGLAQVSYYEGDLRKAWIETQAVLARYPTQVTALAIASGIRNSMRPLLTTSFLLSVDSDENRVLSLGDAVEWGLRPGLNATAQIRWFRSESIRFGQVRDAGQVHVQLQQGRLRGGIGMTSYARTNAIAPLFTVGYRQGMGDAYLVRYGLFDTPALADRRLMVTEAGAALTPVNRTIRLFTETSLARYSDGNTRYRLAADLSRPAQVGGWAVSTGIRSQMHLFRESGIGYFAPAWAGVGTARAIASGPFFHPTLRLDTGLDLGIQNVKPFGLDATGLEPSFAVRSTLHWSNGSWGGDAGATYSTLFNATSQAVDNRYRVWVFQLNLRHRF